MATYDFRKLGDVEALESVPENANALVEVGGEIKRVPGSNLGGGGGIPTAILKMDVGGSDGKSVASLKESRAGAAIYTATCDNMTFAEVKALMLAGEPVSAILGGIQITSTSAEVLWAPVFTVMYSGHQRKASGSDWDEAVLVDTNWGVFYWNTDDHITTDANYIPSDGTES